MEFSSFLPNALFDPYDRGARLYPGLLALVPLPVVLVCLYGASHPWLSGTLSILSFCGGGYLLGRISRDVGKRLQERLFAKWNGAPTTQLLRFRDPTLDRYTKERYHGILSKGLGKSLPTVQEEESDPVAADELYRAAVIWLIGQTRETKKFPLIFKENIAFGFHRNSFGIRWYGIAVAVICTAWVLINAGVAKWAPPFVSAAGVSHLDPANVLALVVSAVMLFTWVAFLREAPVRRTGFAYAERLLEGCDHLGSTPASRRKRS